ncbi:MAG: phage minor head protein [Bullifex sp.]
MKKYQKETVQLSLEQEKKVLNSLTAQYTEARKSVKAKIKKLMDRGDLPHVIHQLQYQKAIASQIDEALSKLKSGEIKTISDYLQDSYGEGFTSSLYHLQKQGIPLIFPMDKNEIIRAVQLNSKISGGFYKGLGINTLAMKTAIKQEITRGISSAMSYGDIARNIDNRMNSGLYNSYRIARTEGHRINQEASFDAMSKAKDAGADIVKQWDSTLDGRTRPHHRELNGQVRELDEPFEVAGLKAMHPAAFGRASEDINCRCVVLEIGRWELDEEDTYTKFDGNEGVIVGDLSNTENYNTFKVGYYDKLIKNETVLLNQLDTGKQYSGIWKDNVTIADYPFKKGAIQAKKDYFNAQIAAGKHVDKFKKALADLDDFEKQGIKYESHYLKIKDYKAGLNKAKSALPKSDADIINDAFSQERRNNAYWFTDKNGSTREADKVLRDKCGEVWRSAGQFEKYSIYDYTESYHKFNEPLRGIEYGTNKYLGVGNVNLDKIGVNGYGGFKPGEIRKEIDAMTAIIEKSSYDFDIWVNRGCGLKGMDKFFGVDPSVFNLPEDKLADALLGTTPVEHAFMSTGVAKGKGFGGDIKLNIYCPKGTKMMYVEPFSAYGSGAGKKWDGISKQSNFGYESEMIIQRGTMFRVTKVEKTSGTIYVDLEVIGQEVY